MGAPPKPGDLAPHPMGAAWSQNLLDLYRIMVEDSAETSATIPTFYFYPLLARHCSEENLQGTQDSVIL